MQNITGVGEKNAITPSQSTLCKISEHHIRVADETLAAAPVHNNRTNLIVGLSIPVHILDGSVRLVFSEVLHHIPEPPHPCSIKGKFGKVIDGLIAAHWKIHQIELALELFCQCSGCTEVREDQVMLGTIAYEFFDEPRRMGSAPRIICAGREDSILSSNHLQTSVALRGHEKQRPVIKQNAVLVSGATRKLDDSMQVGSAGDLGLVDQGTFAQNTLARKAMGYRRVLGFEKRGQCPGVLMLEEQSLGQRTKLLLEFGCDGRSQQRVDPVFAERDVHSDLTNSYPKHLRH